MEVSDKSIAKMDTLEYVADMLTTLADMITRADAPLLAYFLHLAVAQAHVERDYVLRQVWLEGVPCAGTQAH